MVWKNGPGLKTCQKLKILGMWGIWDTKHALEAKSQKCGEQNAYKIIATS